MQEKLKSGLMQLRLDKKMEEEFKKQFPGISNQGWLILSQFVTYDRILDKDDKKMIMKHCLDKQRVEKAFKNLRQFVRMIFAGSPGILDIEDAIAEEEKELGLEDEKL